MAEGRALLSLSRSPFPTVRMMSTRSAPFSSPFWTKTLVWQHTNLHGRILPAEPHLRIRADTNSIGIDVLRCRYLRGSIGLKPLHHAPLGVRDVQPVVKVRDGVIHQGTEILRGLLAEYGVVGHWINEWLDAGSKTSGIVHQCRCSSFL
jgi:hypothetical protein